MREEFVILPRTDHYYYIVAIILIHFSVPWIQLSPLNLVFGLDFNFHLRILILRSKKVEKNASFLVYKSNPNRVIKLYYVNHDVTEDTECNLKAPTGQLH